MAAEYLPLGQLRQAEDPIVEYVPSEQMRQVDSEVPPVVEEDFPAEQSRHSEAPVPE